MLDHERNACGRLIAALTMGLMLVSSVAPARNHGLTSQATVSTAANEHFAPVLPYRGMYYAPGHGGTGLTLDVDANGYVFAVFYTYDSAGNPYYYLMDGQFSASSPQDVVDSGVLGRLDTRAYISENGECVGSGCSYHEPDRSDANLEAHLVWTTPRRLHLTLGNQSWDIQGGQYTVPDVSMLEGTWGTIVTVEFAGSSASPPQYLARVSRSTKSAADFPTLNLGSDVVVFDAKPLGYLGTPLPTSEDSYIAYDPHTGILLGFYTGAGATNPVITGTAFITGPQTVREYFTDGGQVVGEAIRFRLRAGDTPL